MAAFFYLSSTTATLLVLFTAFAVLHNGGVDRLRDRLKAGREREVEVEWHEDDERVSRDSFPLDGDVAWIVQVSDLHLSAYHPERGDDLVVLLAPALRIIRPCLVLITGDITDAKNRERTISRQDEKEWIQYINAISAVIQESGINQRRFFDLRGNHDKYGVPCIGDKLDFFSVYSISSQLNRRGTVQSISLVGKDHKYIFLGIDDTMKAGIRGPSHLFGHPTDARIAMVGSELQDRDADRDTLVTKVVFGHFPMSFTSSSETGKRYEAIFAEQSVSAYLCGHLHTKFGKKLWRRHMINLPIGFKETEKIKQFSEWELGDWKESRLIRILAIDQGMVSFVDIALGTTLGHQGILEAAILITHPLDSRNMAGDMPKFQKLRTDVRALVFSHKPIINVTAKVYDSRLSFALVEEIPLKIANDSGNYQVLFHSSLDAKNYQLTSSMRYWIQIFVFDSSGNEFASEKRPFSLNGIASNVPITWLSYLVFHLQWESLYLILLWSNISFLFMLLLIPKLARYLMGSNASSCMCTFSASTPTSRVRRISFSVLWFLIEGSRIRVFWCTMAFYLVYLATLPWLWGHATSETGEISKMFLFGWRVKEVTCPSHKGMIGYPDVMTVTLPFMYLVVSPLFLLIYSLFSERSALVLHHTKKSSCSEEHQSVKVTSVNSFWPIDEAYKVTRDNATHINTSSIICNGYVRTSILCACLIQAYIHFKQVSSLMAAYGVRPVALSPAICWMPPFLLAAAIYYSRPSACGKRIF